MEDLASILVDIYFQNDQIGWVVGGRSVRPNPRRDDVVPTVLKTEDGGHTWKDMLEDINVPLGEWGWKIQFLEDDPDFGVVACENLKAGAIFITEDGGDSWRRQEIRDNCHMINENLEGIGFWDRNLGWVGGWGDATFDSGRTSETRDGGKTWIDLTGSWPKPIDGYPCPPRCNIGQYINRFRFVGEGENRVAYASGNTVYKYTNQELWGPKEGEVAGNRLLGATELKIAADRALVPLTIPEGATSLSVVVYDRFAGQVRTLLEEQNPAAGDRSLSWDLQDDNGQKLPPGQFMVRVTCDGYAESRLIFPERTGTQIPLTASIPHQLRED
ncbi:FlgD immunoglobulin-like domain containing protein [Okeania sp. SIO2B3]|uniref:FlgD immunoglobulin-like domain containing protein n=1 Tax=Okeania sp. SIO2B3 TaxID=2607784 RepID=UPI0025CF1F9C|nr:FlgD immunoglobulin-like domain containing protein [Okeania sp. SIO2B3]